MSKKRLYSDKEISAVLKRAAELHRDQGPTDTSGLTLAELEQIAAEVGIDPAFVKTAATELEEGRTDTDFHFWGGPLSVDLERIVEGEVSEAKWEEIVMEIRLIFGAAGQTGQLGRSLEWIHRDQTGERAHVTLTPMAGQTRIRIFTRMTDWAVGIHAPLVAASTIPAIVLVALLQLDPVLNTGLFLFTVAAAFMLARLAFGALARRQERKARKLLARLDDLIAEPEAALHVDPTAIQQTGRLDPSLLAEEADAERLPPARRRARGR